MIVDELLVVDEEVLCDVWEVVEMRLEVVNDDVVPKNISEESVAVLAVYY